MEDWQMGDDSYTSNDLQEFYNRLYQYMGTEIDEKKNAYAISRGELYEFNVEDAAGYVQPCLKMIVHTADERYNIVDDIYVEPGDVVVSDIIVSVGGAGADKDIYDYLLTNKLNELKNGRLWIYAFDNHHYLSKKMKEMNMYKVCVLNEDEPNAMGVYCNENVK